MLRQRIIEASPLVRPPIGTVIWAARIVLEDEGFRTTSQTDNALNVRHEPPRAPWVVRPGQDNPYELELDLVGPDLLEEENVEDWESSEPARAMAVLEVFGWILQDHGMSLRRIHGDLGDQLVALYWAHRREYMRRHRREQRTARRAAERAEARERRRVALKAHRNATWLDRYPG